MLSQYMSHIAIWLVTKDTASDVEVLFDRFWNDSCRKNVGKSRKTAGKSRKTAGKSRKTVWKFTYFRYCWWIFPFGMSEMSSVTGILWSGGTHSGCRKTSSAFVTVYIRGDVINQCLHCQPIHWLLHSGYRFRASYKLSDPRFTP